MSQNSLNTTALDLVGAGHAHLFVLKRLARIFSKSTFSKSIYDITASKENSSSENYPKRLRVIAPSSYQYYSGMLPGLIAGHFTPEQCRISVKAWAQAAGAEWIEASLMEFNASDRWMRLSNGQQLEVEQVSLATGSVCDLAPFDTYQGLLLSVKPMERFYQQWLQLQQALPQSLAVVGGGAGGFELICAVAHRWQSLGWHGKLYWVIGDKGMLATFPNAVRRHTSAALKRYGVEIIEGRADGYEAGLKLSSNRLLPVAAVILATGGRAPNWVKATGLTLFNGFIEVDAYHRSVSHPFVFAAGDLCVRPTTALKASGVYAVRAGPILAKNLLVSLNRETDAELVEYRPQPRALYLLSCGRQQAIAHYGFLVMQGHWLWLCKRIIDLAFIKNFWLSSQ